MNNKSLTLINIIIILACALSNHSVGADSTIKSNISDARNYDNTENQIRENEISLEKITSKENKKWWERRDSQIDIYYPHNIHNDVMTEKGDSCFLCHSFSENLETNRDRLSAINEISNEPLLAICHSCHVDEQSAPSECNICHSDKKSIWPEDHNFDYIKHHGVDADNNGKSCEGCHLDLNYCTDCHFNRQSGMNNNHPLGFLGRHGIEVRNNSAECASCHLPNYCSDCHRRER